MKRGLLLLLLCCLLFAACTQKSGGIEEPEKLPDLPEPIPQTEPVPDETDYAAELSSAFDGVEETPQAEFEYTVSEGAATLTAYTGGGTAVRVPETLGGFPVAGIATGAFANRSELKVLILPETVTVFGAGILQNTALTALCTPFPKEGGYLGFLWGLSESSGNRAPVMKTLRYLRLLSSAGQAFSLPANGLSGCGGLAALELPANGKLGDSALADCERLAYINAGSLTEIGEMAFDGCVALQSLRFGENLIQIGFAALRNCRSLMELELPFIGESAQAQTGASSERTTFLGYLFGATKPAFSKGFYPAFLRKITLLEGCGELPDFALYECVSLTELSLPDSLKRVGGRALAGCTSLCRLSLPKGCMEIGDGACAGCANLIAVDLPEGIRIGQNAFLGCPLKNS